MDKDRQPGISFDRVFLSKLKYELPSVSPEKFKYDLDFSSSHRMDNGRLIYIITARLYDKFILEITGIFSTIKGAENMTLEEFAKVNATASLTPFIREQISSITSRTPLPHLLLPPINIFALTKQAEAKEISKK